MSIQKLRNNLRKSYSIEFIRVDLKISNVQVCPTLALNFFSESYLGFLNSGQCNSLLTRYLARKISNMILSKRITYSYCSLKHESSTQLQDQPNHIKTFLKISISVLQQNNFQDSYILYGSVLLSQIETSAVKKQVTKSQKQLQFLQDKINWISQLEHSQ